MKTRSRTVETIRAEGLRAAIRFLARNTTAPIVRPASYAAEHVGDRIRIETTEAS